MRHPSCTLISTRLRRILELAKNSLFLVECDGASGNDRLFAHLSNDDRYKIKDTLYECHLCANHQQHLASVAVVTCMDMDMINNLFACSLFLRNDGHWRRLLLAVEKYVQDRLVVTYEAVPGDASQLREAWRSFMLRNLMSTGVADTEKIVRVADDRARGKLDIAFEEFTSLFNAAWWCDRPRRHGWNAV